ncbi:MarR family winged helix-turn-helix transcriptional regulator [Proteocatella sphenisci]|uniref:MarR family winged helix-turn-helix transcriptional regulator n=1 Tax=Proteocatella sphenisci TaxID=181070 RepID=UPI000490AD95|nr:MarR family transcriptional regulator [Proteocatella sphenisci]
MFSLNDCMGFITNIASKKLSEEFNRRLESYGVTRVNWIAIYYIGENNGISQRELSNKMDVNESSIARLLDRMEKEEFTIRTKDLKDRRTTRIFLTDKGKSLRKSLIPLAEEFQNDVTRELSADELEVFKKVLEKMIENL